MSVSEFWFNCVNLHILQVLVRVKWQNSFAFQSSNPPVASGDDIITSQSSVDDHFTGDAWRSMIADLEPNAKRVLSRFSVRSVIEMVCKTMASSVIISLKSVV